MLDSITSRISLSEQQAYELMSHILDGQVAPEMIAGLLTALRTKGETFDEVTGFVKAMRDHAVKIETDKAVVDTCGTGGDGAHTFNISTTAAFITAGAGVHVAKHGNRAVSSRSGSADVLEQLGVNIQLTTEQVAHTVNEIGIGFCFAPLYHQSMKYAAPVRKALGIRTVFNMLGPLLNPFLAKRQVIGVFAPEMTEFFAQILQRLGSEHVFVVHGEDGLDEVTTCGDTRVTELREGSITTRVIVPEDFGIAKAQSSDLKGGDSAENAKILRDILDDKKSPKRDVAVLNAGLAITCAGKAATIEQGVELADMAISSGAALAKLEALVKFSAEA
ncbi:anthranilate phosphoribosyltransferase [candidate division KSB1 bacterium]|nr:anthranilate phosphoribosyltransferase [candidate division KSB1 bacterium]